MTKESVMTAAPSSSVASRAMTSALRPGAIAPVVKHSPPGPPSDLGAGTGERSTSTIDNKTIIVAIVP